MKNLSIAFSLSTIFLFSCGGSEGDSTSITSPNGFNTKLANTTWEKECSVYNKLANEELKDLWNVKTKLDIEADMRATYRTEFFHPADTECKSMMFDTLYISKLEITGKIMTEESIEANGLNETFIFNSDRLDLSPNYSLIYMDSEKLYFGQKSGLNLGETPETRHTSIILDNSFTQIIN